MAWDYLKVSEGFHYKRVSNRCNELPSAAESCDVPAPFPTFNVCFNRCWNCDEIYLKLKKKKKKRLNVLKLCKTYCWSRVSHFAVKVCTTEWHPLWNVRHILKIRWCGEKLCLECFLLNENKSSWFAVSFLKHSFKTCHRDGVEVWRFFFVRVRMSGGSGGNKSRGSLICLLTLLLHIDVFVTASLFTEGKKRQK